MPTKPFFESPATKPNRKAIFSEDKRYRYRLEEWWDWSKPRLGFVMLNPSIADEVLLDPTVTRCISRAQRLGYGGLFVMNLYALVSTDPEQLWNVPDPIGPRNDVYLQLGMRASDKVICGWGNHARTERVLQFRSMLKELEIEQVYCLGLNKTGHPQHPLYIADDASLLEYNFPLS